jgi:hypothetical protein
MAACTCREATTFVEACVPVVAGTPLIGHTLERLLQQQRAPAWAANPQHLAAARAATNYLRFEQLLLRPALVDAADWLEAEALASQQERAELQQGIDAAGKPAAPLLGSAAADAAFLTLLQESDCLAAKTKQQLLAHKETRKLVKGLQRARNQPGGMPASSMQQPSKCWVGQYRTWVYGIVASAAQQTAQHLSSSSSDDVSSEQPSQLDLLLQSIGEEAAAHLDAAASYSELHLQQLQLLLSNNLIRLKQCFLYQTSQLLLAWDEAGKSLSEVANAQIEVLLKDLLPEVKRVATQQPAVLVAGICSSQSSSSDATEGKYNRETEEKRKEAAAKLQQAGLTVHAASQHLFGSIAELTCRPNLRLALRRLLFENHVSEEKQRRFLVKR